jgi:hypothetical protein
MNELNPYSIRFRMQNCSNHFLEWDRVWAHGCLQHCDNRNRFNSAEEIQNYAGIAP